MSKNKKLIFVGIIIVLIIGVLFVVWRCSSSLIRENGHSESQLPQATGEQDGESSNEVAVESDDSNSTVGVQNNGVATYTVDTSNWDLTKVDIVYDTANVAVPVPKGYVASGADGEHTVNTGFVIYEGTGEVTNDNAWDESCTRNQWVWVPVPDVSRIYETDSNGRKKNKLYNFSDTGRTSYSNSNYEPGVLSNYDNKKYFARYGLQGMTKERFLKEMQDEFNETIKSIQKYGGFWIGRYETGNLNAEIPVVQRMNTSINNQDWYTAYMLIQLMNANEKVKTSMIFGCLWDETLQWLVDSGNKTYADMKDSTSWGNYSNSAFEYKNTSGSTSTKSASNGTRIPSGSTEYSKANNIYDMAGNVWDWTLEGYGSNYRWYRGGYYYIGGSGIPASYRYGYSPVDSYKQHLRVSCVLIYKVALNTDGDTLG